MSRFDRRAFIGVTACLLVSCATHGPPGPPPMTTAELTHAIDRAIPRGLTDREGWISDIRAAFRSQPIEPTPERICAVVAVIAQESGFAVNPVVPNLGQIARREIERRAEHAGVPLVVVNGALGLKSNTGRTYGERIDAARTEKDLSDVFEDFVSTVPLGRTLLSRWNPVRTRGPMQVNVAFAERYAAVRPYPFPVTESVDDELFTRRGSIYFGTAHLLGYDAPYDAFLYRFADYNAGQYSSRNAAFQSALGRITGMHLAPDGALIAQEDAQGGDTELAALVAAKRLGIEPGDVRSALAQGRSQAFESTELYRRVFERADRQAGKPLPRAIVPRIELHGPKISRALTTDWYAHRVEARFETCRAATRPRVAP